jgi:hypothetical protein
MVPSSPSPPASALRRLWPATAALVAVQALYILYARRHDYFFLDDFLDFIVARNSGLNFAFLTHDVFGQLAPGYRFADYVFMRVFHLHYYGVRIFDIVAICGSSVFLMLLARAWKVPPLVVWPVMAFIPFSPIFVITLQWFCSALHVYSSMILGVATLACMAVPGRLSQRRRCAAAALLTVALMFYAKILFLTVLLTAIRFFVALEAGDDVAAGARRTLRDVAYFIPIALIYLLAVKLGHFQSGKPPVGIMPVIGFVRVGFFEGFAANLFAVSPEMPFRRTIATMLFLVPVIATSIRNPRALIIWSGFLLQFILGMAAVSYGRVTIWGTDVAALSRYHSETAIFFAACIFVTAGAGSQPWRLPPFRLPAWSGVAVALAIAVPLISASVRVPPLWPQADGRVEAYVMNFRQSLKDAGAGTVIHDDTVPDWIMPDWMAPLNQMHYFALLFKKGPHFTTDKTGAAVIDGNGRLGANNHQP